MCIFFFFFFQAEDGIRDYKVTGVQTCALPIFAVTTGTTRREEWARQARLRRPHGILGDLRDVLGWVADAEKTASARPRLRSMRARPKARGSLPPVQSRPVAKRAAGRRSS